MKKFTILSDIFNFILGILILVFVVLLAGMLLLIEFIMVVTYTLFDSFVDFIVKVITERAEFIVPVLYEIEKIEKFIHSRLKKWF